MIGPEKVRIMIMLMLIVLSFLIFASRPFIGTEHVLVTVTSRTSPTSPTLDCVPTIGQQMFK